MELVYKKIEEKDKDQLFKLIDKVLSELNIDRIDALYIGDTEVDYQTATNAEVDCYLVSYGYRNKEQLKEKIKNPLIIDSLSELIDLLK